MAKRMLVAGPVRTTALYPLTNGHVLGLRARARRANLVVRTREEPSRPVPVQDVRGVDGFGGLVRVTATHGEGRSAVTYAHPASPVVREYGHLWIVLVDD